MLWPYFCRRLVAGCTAAQHVQRNGYNRWTCSVEFVAQNKAAYASKTAQAARSERRCLRWESRVITAQLVKLCPGVSAGLSQLFVA